MLIPAGVVDCLFKFRIFSLEGFALKNMLILKKFIFIKNAAVSHIYRILLKLSYFPPLGHRRKLKTVLFF